MFAAVLIAFLLGGVAGLLVARIRSGGSFGESTQSMTASAASSTGEVDDTLRAAVDQLALGVVIGDADGSVVYRNAAAASLHGTHEGVIIDDHVDRALASGRSGEHVDDQFDLHGPPKTTWQLIAEPMSHGRSVATIQDVSERHRIDAMRTDFVANISHELKTPVGAIAVLAEALFGESDAEVVNRVAGRMVGEAHRAVDAIDDLLELSRIEAAPVLAEDVDLTDIVAMAITRGREVDETKNVTVTAFGAGRPVVVRGDSRQLVSAIGNLVENAVKYSDPDGLVQVRTRVDERAIEVMVADQGHGIPHRDLDRIFERFYRVDRARSRQTGGTGLGLSIVRHVASNHGGDVLVSSTEGEGSTFVLRLPADLLVDPASTGDPDVGLVEQPSEGQPS